MIKKYLFVIELLLKLLIPPFAYFSKIEKFCNRKLQRNPDDVGALWFLSNVYMDYQKYSEAEDHAEKLLRLRPNEKKARYLLSRTYFHLDKYQEIVELLAGEYVPSEKDGENYYLGYAYMKLGKYPEAVAYLTQWLKFHKPTDYVFQCIGYSYAMLGLCDEALKAYKEAQLLNPADEEIAKAVKRLSASC
jgi:tetratricopeptide (TPR) repeat protein